MSGAGEVDVLIAGAGPTGLALANSLARRGVSFRIVDSAAQRSRQSKALGVQAGTLEALGHALGPEAPKEMVQAGWLAREAFIHVERRPAVRVDLGAIPSEYDFILILEQSETERILESSLESAGGRVERETELVSFEDRGDFVLSKLRRADGTTEEVRSKFLAGCDGAHSRVRKQLDIPFSGAMYTGDFLLADAQIRWPWEYGGIRTFVSGNGALACFPMRGNRKYRLITVQRQEAVLSCASELSLEELRAAVKPLAPEPIEIESASWLTRFRVHHRMVSSFRKGRAFLAGDAAHIHSPAGGQGMNTGIQDALNLADKLAQVLKQGISPAILHILDNYERERMPVARGVLRGTDLVFRGALLPENAVVGWVRSKALPRVLASKWIQRRVVRAISEVDVARREIARAKTEKRD